MLATSTFPRDLYDALVVLHVVCALLGFGSLAISGVYGFGSRRFDSPEGREEARRYFASPGRLELLVVVVPFLGVAALALQPGGRGVGQLWAGLAALIWLVAVVTLLRVVRPAERTIRTALAQPSLAEPSLAEPALGADGAGAAAPGAGPAREGLADTAADAALTAAASRLGWAGVVTDLAFAGALGLMIFQPR